MTDNPNAGSVADDAAKAAAASAGNLTEGNTTTLTNGSENGGGDWWAGLQDEGNRSTVKAKGWEGKSLDDVLTSYRNLETQQGSALKVPDGNAPKEAWEEFYGKLGRPEKPEGYEFKLPDGLPETFPYDGTRAEKFKAAAHAAGLSPSQAAKIHDWFVSDANDELTGLTSEVQKAVETSHEAIVQKWGATDSEGYKRNVELATRAMRKAGGEELIADLKKFGMLGPNGEAKSPALAFAFAELGKAHYAEDALHGGTNAVNNPFSTKHFNLTEQGKLIRSDPERAKAFITSAGLKPSDYGFK